MRSREALATASTSSGRSPSTNAPATLKTSDSSDRLFGSSPGTSVELHLGPSGPGTDAAVRLLELTLASHAEEENRDLSRLGRNAQHRDEMLYRRAGTWLCAYRDGPKTLPLSSRTPAPLGPPLIESASTCWASSSSFASYQCNLPYSMSSTSRGRSVAEVEPSPFRLNVEYDY